MGVEYVRRNSHRKVDHHTAASSIQFFLSYGWILQIGFLKGTCLKQWSSGSAWSRYSWVELWNQVEKSNLIWKFKYISKFSFFYHLKKKTLPKWGLCLCFLHTTSHTSCRASATFHPLIFHRRLFDHLSTADTMTNTYRIGVLSPGCVEDLGKFLTNVFVLFANKS